MSQYIDTDFTAQTYQSNTTLPTQCFDITFQNNGATAAMIDNIPVPVGTTIEISCTANQVLRTNYKLTFDTGIGSMLVIRRSPTNKLPL